MNPRERLQQAQKWLQDGASARKAGDETGARERISRALKAFEALGHPRGIVLSTHHLGLTEYQFGRFDAAIRWFER
ncbi:MAG: tetratricopeptide repeat protein, partial [Myxococcales bacterium]|nr:tetratricopeptide repeat protein [Myxococcales bacterium]